MMRNERNERNGGIGYGCGPLASGVDCTHQGGSGVCAVMVGCLFCLFLIRLGPACMISLLFSLLTVQFVQFPTCMFY